MYQFEKDALEGFLMHQINGCVDGECGEYTGPHLECDENGCVQCHGDSPDHQEMAIPQEMEMQRRGMRPGARRDEPSPYEVAMQRTFRRDNRDVWDLDDYNQPEDPRAAMMQMDPRMGMMSGMQMDPRRGLMAMEKDHGHDHGMGDHDHGMGGHDHGMGGHDHGMGGHDHHDHGMGGHDHHDMGMMADMPMDPRMAMMQEMQMDPRMAMMAEQEDPRAAMMAQM